MGSDEKVMELFKSFAEEENVCILNDDADMCTMVQVDVKYGLYKSAWFTNILTNQHCTGVRSLEVQRATTGVV